MKFLSWFLAIIIILAGIVIITVCNFKLIIFSPQATKNALNKIDFYSQIKSVIKKDLFESTDNKNSEIIGISRVINKSFEEYNFQPPVEVLIDNFYFQLDEQRDFTITLDLFDFKRVFISNAEEEIGESDIDSLEIPIPDKWQVDLNQYKEIFQVIAFFYHNLNIILVIYGILFILFLLACLKVGIRYLKLFFSTILIIGILLFAQRFLISYFDPQSFLSSVTEQGRTGLQLVVENFISYIREKELQYLFWESIIAIVVSVIGIIIVSVSGKKISNIPLDD